MVSNTSIPFCDDNVSASFDHRHPVGVEQLTIALADLAKLELEPTLLVENLDPEVTFRIDYSIKKITGCILGGIMSKSPGVNKCYRI